MGFDKPRRGHASSSKPRVDASMDYGEAKGAAVTSNSQGANPDGSDNIWQVREAQEEERTMFQKENEYRRNLHKNYLQKAAANVESRRRVNIRTGGGGSGDLPSTARPVIWGSALYRGLWAKAAKIIDTGS